MRKEHVKLSFIVTKEKSSKTFVVAPIFYILNCCLNLPTVCSNQCGLSNLFFFWLECEKLRGKFSWNCEMESENLINDWTDCRLNREDNLSRNRQTYASINNLEKSSIIFYFGYYKIKQKFEKLCDYLCVRLHAESHVLVR